MSYVVHGLDPAPFQPLFGLSDQELASLAARSNDAQQKFAAGALSRPALALIVIALVVLIAGVIAVQSNRVGLVDERLAGIQEQSQIVASTLAE